ncbi:MAG TPA: hypothetical protein VMY88_02240 [Acidimicrobiales bacterium]|nr:hypothetical protein [Acidimicrobiales bacterium]
MTDEHKAALSAGRQQGAIVRRYLDALDANRPKRGRKRTPESIRKRLEAIDSQLNSKNSLVRLQLMQEHSDLQKELETMSSAEPVDISVLEEEFARSAAEYGRRKGISYDTWRRAGVSSAVLKKAGISRGA